MSQKEMAEVFKRTLALKSYPVGVKFCQNSEKLKTGKIPTEKLTFCQMVKLASQGRWQLACPKDQMGCFTAQLIFGFRPQSEQDIEHHMKQFTDNREIAEKMIAVKPKFKLGEIAGILVRPLDNLEPDLVILIVDSSQALPLIEAYAVATGKDLSFRNGVSSALCSYGAVVAYQTQKPNLSIPCIGAKRYGLFQDYELIFTMPFELSKTISNALLELEKTNRLHLPIVQGYLSPTKPVDYLLKS
ncbi:MAG: DUF169 domain-containing protein [candidate division WOR-3 bacterium]